MHPDFAANELHSFLSNCVDNEMRVFGTEDLVVRVLDIAVVSKNATMRYERMGRFKICPYVEMGL